MGTDYSAGMSCCPMLLVREVIVIAESWFVACDQIVDATNFPI